MVSVCTPRPTGLFTLYTSTNFRSRVALIFSLGMYITLCSVYTNCSSLGLSICEVRMGIKTLCRQQSETSIKLCREITGRLVNLSQS